jgi:GxxExxY protein
MRGEKSKPERTEEAEIPAPTESSGLADNEITEKIIGAAIEVHRHLGPGLLESAYEECLCYELKQIGLSFERQVHVPIAYKGLRLDCFYKMDVVVEDRVVVEIKTVEHVLPIHTAQLLTYLKSSNKQVGLLINFNEVVLKKGLKRLVNGYRGPVPAPRTSAPSAAERTPDTNGVTSLIQSLHSSPRDSPRLSASAVNRLVLSNRSPH